ncbi:hypothetical protein [Maribacter sp. R86514]|uniref:hypothetical protein n=1 Tax=Maribacter sp. R86514 TaxID=3093854 RepID=UPI0037CACFB9
MSKKLSDTEIQNISKKHFKCIQFIQRAKNSRYGLFFCSEHNTKNRQYLNSHIKGINPCKVCRKKAGRPRKNSISEINKRLDKKFNMLIKFHSYHPVDKKKAHFECKSHGKTTAKYLGNVLHSNQKNNPCNNCHDERVFEPPNKLSLVEINNRLVRNKSKLSMIRRKSNNSRFGIFKCELHGHIKKALHINSVFVRKSNCPKCKCKTAPPNKFSKDQIQNLSNKVLGNFIFLGRSKKHHNIGFFICEKHFEKGIHKQFISNHLRGFNPCCGKVSKGEAKVAKYLINKGYKFSQNQSFDGCKDIRSLRFDFFVPDLNLLIEFDGEQHYKPIARFGGNKKHINVKKRDKIKTDFAKRRNHNFLRIPFTHLSNINNILNNKVTEINQGNIVFKEIKPKK